jgi:hypothetical protein
MVRTDPRGQSRVVDQRCHCLAEAVRRNVGHPEFVALSAQRGRRIR